MRERGIITQKNWKDKEVRKSGQVHYINDVHIVNMIHGF